MPLLRAVVVAEPIALRQLREILRTERDVVIAAELATGAEAVELLRREPPDVLFLDVSAPKVDGAAILEAIDPASIGAVVLLSSRDQPTLRPFDSEATTLLVKPLDRARVGRALRAARQHVALRRTHSLHHRLETLLQRLNAHQSYVQRLAVKARGTYVFVRVADIDWIDAARNYVRLNVGERTYRLRQRIGVLSARLDPRHFRRIHRSTIVNLDRISALQSLSHGELLVVLDGGKRLTVSRRYRSSLADLLG